MSKSIPLLNSLKTWMVQKPQWFIWWSAFFYSAVVAILIQFVVLPLVFSQWHQGDGLLIGGDWSGHHHLAVELLEKIRAEGWQAWILRPNGQAPAGIAAAIYALTVPEPWTLIPLNAALHALSVLFVFHILRLLVQDWRKAIWGVLPFMLFPSAALWYTQILKDSYSIPGFLMFVYGWMLLVRLETWQRVRFTIALPFLSIAFGAFLMWLVRPYMWQMLQGIGAGLSLLLTIVFFYRLAQRKLKWPIGLTAIAVFWIIVFMLSPPPDSGKVKAIEGPAIQEEATYTSRVNWEKVFWIPDFFDNLFFSIATYREGAKGYPHSLSNIDMEITFNSIWEVMIYLPRSLQIAFLSPFPSQWFSPGRLDSTTLMRRISAFEMLIVYFSVVFLPFGVWHLRKRLELWVLAIFCTGMMVAYTLVIVNAGTIYRVRYGFLLALVGLGISSFVIFIKRSKVEGG